MVLDFFCNQTLSIVNYGCKSIYSLNGHLTNYGPKIICKM
jgi:hypothetical protein